MMWNNYGGAMNWWWMAPVMVLFWGAVIVGVVLLIRAFARPRVEGEQAMDILRKRLASGAIDQDEFDKTKRTLLG